MDMLAEIKEAEQTAEERKKAARKEMADLLIKTEGNAREEADNILEKVRKEADETLKRAEEEAIRCLLYTSRCV